MLNDLLSQSRWAMLSMAMAYLEIVKCSQIYLQVAIIRLSVRIDFGCSASIAGSKPKFLQCCHFSEISGQYLQNISCEYFEKHCQTW